MSDGGLTILDGTQLSGAADIVLPDGAVSGTLTGALLLELAESRASELLFGLTLPDPLKSAVLRRLGIADDELVQNFLLKEFDREDASSFLKSYYTAMADELKDDPTVVAILDGQNLRLILEDEDDFAMLAENLFTDIDTEDRGKIRKCEIQNALVHMGIEMGIPPISEFPQLSDFLKKHNAEGEEEVGQAQFAQLLQSVLQDLADALGAKHVTVVQNLKIVNGYKIRKLLKDQKQLDDVLEKIMQEKKDERTTKTCKEIIRSFLEENGKELGLPPLRADEMVVLLYDAVFADIDDTKKAAGSENSLRVLLKEILEKFAEQLEASPVFYDLGL